MCLLIKVAQLRIQILEFKCSHELLASFLGMTMGWWTRNGNGADRRRAFIPIPTPLEISRKRELKYSYLPSYLITCFEIWKTSKKKKNREWRIVGRVRDREFFHFTSSNKWYFEAINIVMQIKLIKHYPSSKGSIKFY